MGFFRPKIRLPASDFSSTKHKRPLELGTKSGNIITKSIRLLFGKTVVPARNLVSNPFSPYLAWQKKRRMAGTNLLLRQAYAKNELFMKKYAPEIQQIHPTLTQHQIMPFGDQILRAMGGIEERLARVEKGNPRKMDKEDAFARQGITRRLTTPELEILKKHEANRQYVLAESQSMIREIALAALSPGAKQTKLLEDVKKRQPNLIANSQKSYQELSENRTLYAQLEREYTAMTQRMIGKEGKEEFAGPGKTANL